MKKILLFTFSLLTFNLSFAQITCSPKFVYGCNAMGIDQIKIDSSATLKFNSSTLSAGCQNSSTGFSDFTLNGAVTDLCKGNTYSFTIKAHSVGFTNQNAAIYIDFNGNNSFADPGEYISAYTIYMDYITIVDVSIPSDAQIGKSTMRIITSSTDYASLTQDDFCNGNLQYGEAEDFLINIKEAPMRIVSTTTNAYPYGTLVQAGETNKYVMQVQVVAKNSFSPLSATNFEFTTTGTNKISSIKNAKLWYTGLDGYNNYFDTLVGSDIINPKATFNITGNQPLVEGTNYFWLTYDLAEGAVPGDTLKATSEKITISSNIFTPDITSPPTEGLIVDYCTNSFESSCQDQSSNSNNIKEISIGSLKKTNISCAYNNYNPPIDYETLTLYQGGNTGYGIKNGDNKRFYAIFIDYNKDGKYTGANEFYDLGQLDPLVTLSGSIKTPIDAITGAHRLRILYSDNQITNDLFCLKSTIGESHDYNVQIYAPYNMAIRNAYYYKEGNLIAPIPSANNEILKFNITVNGSSNPIGVKKLIFNTNNTDVTNIENAKVWFGGIVDNLSAATQVGTIITNPSGEFSIDADVNLLDESTNYFWLTYDVPTKAKENQSLSASIVSVTDNNGKEIKITEDKNYYTYPGNILGTRKTAGSVAMKTTTIVTCNSTFYDDGGKNGVYSSNNYTTTFKADSPNSKMKITFNKLSLGTNGETSDQIDIYNGSNVEYTYLNTNLSQFDNSNPYVINSDTDAITIAFTPQFQSDGWEAVVSCVYDCEKDPLRFNAVDSVVTCGNEFHKTTIKITAGGSFPPFRYIIKDYYNNNNIISINETNDVSLITYLKQGSYQLFVENSKGCSQDSVLNISDNIANPINYNSYNTYTDKYPTCNIANDGVINLTDKFKNSPEWYRKSVSQDSISFEWNEVGKKEVFTSNTIPNVKYFIKYHVKSSVGGICRTDTISMVPYYQGVERVKTESSPGNFNPDNDTAYALVAYEKPIISDLNFTIGKIDSSDVTLEQYNCPDCYPVKTLLPDSIHWLISPNNAASINPGYTISKAIWDKKFSGTVKIKAEPFKGVCRGTISPEETVIIKPFGELKTSNTIKITKGDSAEIVLKLEGTKPYSLTYRLPRVC